MMTKLWAPCELPHRDRVAFGEFLVGTESLVLLRSGACGASGLLAEAQKPAEGVAQRGQQDMV
jgi:hypothetical protein